MLIALNEYKNEKKKHLMIKDLSLFLKAKQ